MVVNGYLLAAIGSKKFGAVNGCFKKKSFYLAAIGCYDLKCLLMAIDYFV